MKCYDCGGEIASGTGTCPSCGCPAGRDEAAECLGARLLTAQLESIGCNVRKSPLMLSVAGLVVSAFFLSGVFGVVIAGVMALSVWFAVLYTKAVARERELRAKLEKLK